MTDVVSRLQQVLGPEKVLTSLEDRIAYSYDGTFEQDLPDVVVLPESTRDVADVVHIGAECGVPIIPRGMASGLAAASVPFGGGIVLSMTRMNRILEIDEANRTIRVEAGVVTADLESAVGKKGLFYPPDPSSNKQSTIGGNIACNAGGPRCLKYGVTGDYVLGLTVVLPDGRVLETGGKAIKNVVGYDLNSFFVGSEGTLGVITEALLRLTTQPRFIRTARAEFLALGDACQAVNAILDAGVVPATLEMMDETAIACIEEAMELGLPLDVEAILIIETDGSDAESVLRDIEIVARVCRENGAREVVVADTEAQREQLWRARRSVSPSLARKAPSKLGEDITVPRSAIPEAVRRIKAISVDHGLPVVIFGHAGDGNLHPNILFDRRDEDQWRRVEQMVADIFQVALDVGGTLSGEHGVGTLKKPYLAEAVGPVAMDVMRSIRHALDPQGIMNPGKIFD
ncbi:MAG: FAD-binding oxidoreductase [Chloroflexota bacterium]